MSELDSKFVGTDTTPPTIVRDQVNALLAGFLGWTLDAFDFFLVPFCASQIAKDFNVTFSDIMLSVTFTLAFRPIGAFIFGLLADRYGRRLPLMLDLVFYSIVEVATGFAPGYRSFIVLRALFGIGMGGEWGVGASLAMEKVSPRWRGVLSGLLQEGYALGNLLAALAYLFVFPKWGWRPLFWIGGIPALLALMVRYGVKESAVWEKTRHTDWKTLINSISRHWLLILELMLLMTVMMCSSHGTQDLYPAFLEKDWDFSPQKRAIITAITAVGAILGGITFGLWSDRIGRRRAMSIAFACALLVIPIWSGWPAWLVPGESLALLVTGGFLMQFMVQGAWGIIPAHISEMSPDSVRGFLPGFAYQMGALFSAALPWLVSRWVPKDMPRGYGRPLALSAMVVFAVAIIVVLSGREKKGIQFGHGDESIPATPGGVATTTRDA